MTSNYFISKRFQFCYKVYLLWVLSNVAIYIFAESFRAIYKRFLFHFIVFTLMGLNSIFIYASKNEFSFSDTIEDIVKERGRYSPTSAKISVCMAYISLLMPFFFQLTEFIYSWCVLFDLPTNWFHGR